MQLITKRLKHRFKNGMVNEVKTILKKYKISYDRLDYFGLEYKFVGAYLKNELTKDELTDKLHIAISQFAKRQMRWFRRMEKRGIKINWVNPADKDHITSLIKNAI